MESRGFEVCRSEDGLQPMFSTRASDGLGADQHAGGKLGRFEDGVLYLAPSTDR